MPTAVIIGASSGIGKAIAFQLCARGFRVGIAARNEEALAEISRLLNPEQCVYQAFDISQIEAALAGFEQLQARLGSIDFVYLVAGVGFLNVELTGALEEETVAVNCLGFTALASAALRLFQRQGQGHLVAVTSFAAARPSGDAPAYGASKAFGSAYLEGLRYWTLRRKVPIYITEVRPGFVDTAMMKSKKTFWVISAERAAKEIIAAADRRKTLAYVPARWRGLAWVVKVLPDWLYARLGE